jgi:fructosamine-3-kinase
LEFHPVGGGSINEAYRIRARDGRQWFCKINDTHRFPGLFEKERDGLALLAAQRIFRVPSVIACETVGTKQVLILEWIESGAREGVGGIGSGRGGGQSRGKDGQSFWRLLGEQLARLHQVSGDRFGLDSDNYMGALPQSNTYSAGWEEFFTQRRLEPQIRLAADRGLLGSEAIRQFERLYKALPGIFPEHASPAGLRLQGSAGSTQSALPSLVHGDLWSGNFLCDTEGRPVLIDPAVYFGYPGMDLAMTTLFGGFDRAFYESYAYYSPFPANYREQWDICNLYPLLIHLNLFGKSYLGAILDTIQPY